MKKEATNAELSSATVLLSQARLGCSGAFESLAEKFVPQLRRMASSFVPKAARCSVDLEGIVLEALRQGLAADDSYRPPSDGSLLLRLRKNLLQIVAERCAGLTTGKEGNMSPTEAAPIEKAVGSSTWRQYVQALERLEESQQAAVVLFVECGASFELIAESLGHASTGVARLEVARALKKLSEAMDVRN